MRAFDQCRVADGLADLEDLPQVTSSGFMLVFVNRHRLDGVLEVMMLGINVGLPVLVPARQDPAVRMRPTAAALVHVPNSAVIVNLQSAQRERLGSGGGRRRPVSQNNWTMTAIAWRATHVSASVRPAQIS